MATTTLRKISPQQVRDYSTQHSTSLVIPDLTTIQTKNYDKFLQFGKAHNKREDSGIEAVLREIFPIESYDKRMRLEYVRYRLDKPRYTPDECRQLRLTYGHPFKVTLRLHRPVRDDKDGKEVEMTEITEEVFFGEVPIMLGGGEFIINGAERVVVSQLHRSPGVDFVLDAVAGSERKAHACRIIPERGSWIELNVSRKEALQVRIDQSGKFPVTMLLRAMEPEFSDNCAILRALFPSTEVKATGSKCVAQLKGKVAIDDVVYSIGSERAGEVIVEAGEKISEDKAEVLANEKVVMVSRIDSAKENVVEVFEAPRSSLLLGALAEDPTHSHEDAVLRLYQRLRPGNPPQLEKARALFAEKFHDLNRYRLGAVGRFRINRKLGLDLPADEMTLCTEDIIAAIKHLVALWTDQREMKLSELRRCDIPHNLTGKDDKTFIVEVDDIDHLENRRIRTIDELAGDELRKGFLKLRRTVQERMGLKELPELSPRSLANPKSVSAAFDYFFGRGELSQVVDQTNPLAMLTHERRLSALGPGGLNRKRAGFEVRDVHISHYGRICPIETPEGSNIGLISSLGIYASVDDYGFLITPYRIVENGKLTNELAWLRADQERDVVIAPADTQLEDGVLQGDLIITRRDGEYELRDPGEVDYLDISASQMVGVSAGLIPFLEHDDANRALMGSNMQRQAVPLLVTEKPLVGTGMEREAAINSSMIIRARTAGVVKYVDSARIVVGEDFDAPFDEGNDDEYLLRKFVGLNERTCQNQKPVVKLGQPVEAGTVLADGAATCDGQLSLGRNVLVGFMAWDGFNFEDAIIISEELVQNDTYTSIHVEAYDVEIRETKLGREEFTRDIPNVSEKMLRNLDDGGVVRVGTHVKPGDLLVGKVSPKSKTELTPEEKLLHAIFGRAGEDVKNDSLIVPSGVEGIVVDTQKFSRQMSLTEYESKEFEAELKNHERNGNAKIVEAFARYIETMDAELGVTLTDDEGNALAEGQQHSYIVSQARQFEIDREIEKLKLTGAKATRAEELHEECWAPVDLAIEACDRAVNSMKRGDELRSGVLKMVKVYIAMKRVISVGDKMAGRHGNKGVIAKILPKEDMPHLEDGTPIQIMLNPLGVPSRMNVGQILETHLGWAAGRLGFQAITPIFDGPNEKLVRDTLEEADLPRSGKVQLYDGRTGEKFGQHTTVGYIYMLKLHHLVDDKVHARSTGPYSLITQQPLGGKARFGGQRFGEMEVWALEAYGAAYILQELLTVKSDDVEGRTKIYESMVKGENTLEAGTPASFDVLTNEIRGLGLNMQLEKARGASFAQEEAFEGPAAMIFR